MSEPVVIVCLDCAAAMPPMGDYGFLGWPSMDDKPTPTEADGWDWAEFVPFGFLRKTFAEIGISTDEIEQVAEFLRQHNGHRFGISADGQLQDDSGDDEEGQAAVDRVEEEGGVPTPLSYTPRPERAGGRFVLGHYRLACKCGATYESPHADVVRPLPEIVWTPRLLELLKTQILEADCCNFWRLTSDLLDPDAGAIDTAPPLRAIAAFVSEHMQHGVTAAIRKVDT